MESHKITVNTRSEIEITGVTDVEAYNDEEIEILTTEGEMVINGSKFNIIKLDVESGELKISGRIDSLYYNDKSLDKERSNFLQRIFNK
jgi:sporulation protein YabP